MARPLPLRLPGFGFKLNEAMALKAIPAQGYVTNVLDKSKLTDMFSKKNLFPTFVPATIDGSAAIRDRVHDGLGHQRASVQSKGFVETGNILVYDAGVVKSDTAIPTSLRDALKAAAACLEDVPDEKKDYHPHSDDQVLNLVHPSLFPVIYGRTRIIKDGVLGIQEGIARMGSGEVLKIPSREETTISPDDRIPDVPVPVYTPYSQKFQWLPCDVEFTAGYSLAEGVEKDQARNKCNVTSYINNTHPKRHPDLYRVIERVMSLAVALWNITLSSFEETRFYARVPYYGCDLEIDPEAVKLYKKPEGSDDDEDETYYTCLEEWEARVHKAVLPEPTDGFYSPSENISVDLQRDYGKTGLQVIVKLANIHLTLEKPKYSGGTWNIEGQWNEHICATALYYYDSVNITESRLAFRQCSAAYDTDHMYYAQDNHGWVQEVFGCSAYGPPVQEVGDVVCKEGRLINFPNFLQHRVSPFELQDPSKPGHRKILALFLVDPNIRIISSANVPCQRRDWWEEEVQSRGQAAPEVTRRGYISIRRLPNIDGRG
ncbi:hypothetical protein AJ79_06485 [Helicocarpus griseus UAMH5409]|uniref:DUF4246 domain-containing protein n=1 Tax=Helicocarpus griseus UAMH5409 TaxID=1447875 RepID=A0A2B7XBQ9_9EURO|nr:hypothetical protein AJ79_06485 [Helicocarpus griseus UAMH5409]